MKKLKRRDPRDGWYQITAKEASEIVAGRKHNRALSSANVAKIASDIKSGRWRENGESLVFAVDGSLLDGQHRLYGCVEAGIPIVVYCVFGVDPDTFPTFDGGRARTGSDLASILNFKNYKVCNTAADWCIKYDRTKPGGRFASGEAARITNIQRQEFLTQHRDLIEEVAHSTVSNLKSLRRLSNGPNLFSGVLAIISRCDRERAHKWFSLLCSGEGLSAEHPVMLLRNRLIDLKSAKYKATQTEILALCLKSFCYYRDGRRVKLIKFGSEEAFPRLETP